MNILRTLKLIPQQIILPYARFVFQNCKSDEIINEIGTKNEMTFKMLHNFRTKPEPDLMVLCETEV